MSEERAELLAFLGVFFRMTEEVRRFEETPLPVDAPLAGLRMAVGDMLEMTDGMAPADLAEIERRLAEAGAPSLAVIRLRYAKRLNAILKRGVIRSEAEYHLVRNFAEAADPAGEGAALWALISAYETA